MQGALEKLDEVAKAEVDFQKKLAKVTLKSGQTLTKDKVVEALKKAGKQYSLTSFQTAEEAAKKSS